MVDLLVSLYTDGISPDLTTVYQLPRFSLDCKHFFTEAFCDWLTHLPGQPAGRCSLPATGTHCSQSAAPQQLPLCRPMADKSAGNTPHMCWLAKGTTQQLTHFTCCCVSRGSCLQLSMCPAASVQQLSPCWDVLFSGEWKIKARNTESKHHEANKEMYVGVQDEKTSFGERKEHFYSIRFRSTTYVKLFSM